ncbi:MAG: universal stress protein [Micromonosporaceae bacterium]|nr:universal stress protein [Micromonosporaceae bacterium]
MEGAQYPVVVGIDGSASSRGALRWAAAEASARGLALRIIHAARSAEPELWSAARAMIADAVSTARKAQPGLVVSGDVIDGKPVNELCAASERANLLVVASRGIGGFDGLLLGPVSAQVALHASSAVTIIHGAEAMAESIPDHAAQLPVVVGADSSHESELAIGAAFEEASVREAPVLALRVWRPPLVAYRGKVSHSKVDHRTIEQAAAHTLYESVARWRTKYPDVAVETRVVADSPAGALALASASAQLVVVGSRGHGSYPGPRLGATTSQLIHHARCPVMLVRARSDPQSVGS